MHTHLLNNEMDESNSYFAKWYRKNDCFANEVNMKRGRLKGHLNALYCQEVNDKSAKFEPLIATEILKDSERMLGSKDWAPRKWMSNNEFKTTCNVLAGASRLTKSKLCHRCGAENSIEHAMWSCSWFKAKNKKRRCSLRKMLESPESCSIECAKLTYLTNLQRKNTVFTKLNKKRVTVWNKNESYDVICLASLKQDSST